jgi:hypothetical protein
MSGASRQNSRRFIIPKSRHQIELARILSFSDDDLASNREGKLSSLQTSTLAADGRKRTITMLGLAMLASILGGVALAIILTPVLALVLGLAAFLVAGYIAYLTMRAGRKRINQRGIQTLEGPVQVTDNPPVLTIKGQSTPVTRDVLKTFHNGETYRLYISGKHLLSAETLDRQTDTNVKDKLDDELKEIMDKDITPGALRTDD